MAKRIAEVDEQVKMEGEGNDCGAHSTFAFAARTKFGPLRDYITDTTGLLDSH